MTPELGVCYYPEHWPEDQWPQQAQQMRSMGLSWVRVGEFAWSRLEPRPDDFKWEWLDRAVAILGAAGLKVILGTPTATPPRWMLKKHPEMLACDSYGQPRKFGSRRHYCFSHMGYHNESVRITQKMAERYSGNPHVMAWQTDNEYGCHETTLSYSLAAQQGFRLWLANKYESVDQLNEAWGNVFWSMDYPSFDHIDLPNLTVTEANPAHVMDFRRYSSDQVVLFNRAQCEVLRQYTSKPLIHNYMGRITDFDHFDVGEDLDIASWDSYPLGFLEDRSDQGDGFKHKYMRQGDPDFQAFHHDLYRAVGKGRWWVMEQQPGPVNWAPYNPAPRDGMVRLWTWEAIAHGAEVVSYFRWRQAPFAQEQMHAGLQRPDGVVSAGGREAAITAKEISNLPEYEIGRSRTAIIFDYPSAWAWETQPQGKDFDYFRLVYDIYRGLRRLGLSVDVLPSSTTDFGDRKLVFIPGLFAWTSELREAVSAFSGKVIAGPRTGSKTEDFQIPDALPPNIQGFESKVSAVESLRPSAPIVLSNGGHFHIWRELIETSHGACETSIDGNPAVIQNGNLYYLAGWPDDLAMDRILSNAAKDAGLQTYVMDGGKRRREFGSYALLIDYDNGDIQVTNINTNERLF